MAARDAGADRVELWVDPRPGAVARLARRYPDLRARPQGPGDLGARLADAFGRTFSERCDYAVIVGSDHPTLPPAYLERAFDVLRTAHLVLGPATDGGYYAIGLRRYAWPRAACLFDGIPWSTPEVLGETRRCAERLGLCHVELPAWYDIDEPDALGRLAREADPGSATGRALSRGAARGRAAR